MARTATETAWGGLPLGSDLVFADNTPEQRAAQTLVLTGDPATGLKASATICIAL